MSESIVMSSTDWNPEEVLLQQQKTAISALQTALQQCCHLAQLDAPDTLTALTSTFAWIVLMNATSLDTAHNTLRNHKKQLRKIIDANWERIQPIKENFVKQLAEQAASQKAQDNVEQPGEEDTTGGNVRTDSTG